MKPIVLTVLLIFSIDFSHAAKWEKVEISDSAFSLLKDIPLHHSVYQFVSAKKSEDFVNSLKQLTYIVRGEWGEFSIPNHVKVFPGTSEFEVLTNETYRTEPEPILRETIVELTEFTLIKGLNVDIYEGYDGNRFGSCANAYLHEKISQQVGVFSLCYGE